MSAELFHIIVAFASFGVGVFEHGSTMEESK